MELLFDTHVFLWGRLEPERITSDVAGELEDPSNGLWLSPISVWEILVLAEKGQVTLQPSAPVWIETALREVQPREASLNHQVALLSRSLNLPREAPVDRFLAATAAVYDLTLVTADGRLIDGSGYSVLPCTRS